MKLVWCSDIHLDFLKNREDLRVLFYEEVETYSPDVVVISGDIADSKSVVQYLEEMQSYIAAPIYFVLGNHDFYNSDVKSVKKSVGHLNWIPGKGVINLTEQTVIVGVDGWGDCRNGDYENSQLLMSDWLVIKDLNVAYLKGYVALRTQLQKLADEDAHTLKMNVELACKQPEVQHLIIVSHVPPFKEVCSIGKRTSTLDGLPFFSSKILGDTILPLTQQFPDVFFHWLCGHTHSKIMLRKPPNLTVQVAGARYFLPKVAGVIDYV